MSDLTETEILSCMKHNLRLAAQYCDRLATLPVQGQNFAYLRQSLKLVEGCCRQMSAWREDTRWLPLGIMMESAHQRARDWCDTRRSYIRRGTSRPLFEKLAENLRGLMMACDRLETAATGRVGMILPDVLPHDRERGLVQALGFAN